MNRLRSYLDHPAKLLIFCAVALMIIETLRFTHLIRIP